MKKTTNQKIKEEIYHDILNSLPYSAIKFLIQEKVFAKFCKETRNRLDDCIKYGLTLPTKSSYFSKNPIASTFIWGGTADGYVYWRDLSCKYIRFRDSQVNNKQNHYQK
jgi:hypothetical protein